MPDNPQPIAAVALDAMGVIYPVADDLRDLLIPYLRAMGCTVPDEAIIDAYRSCYRYGASVASLWEAIGCDWKDGALERNFLACYSLRPGVLDFLASMRRAGVPVYGLSNDVAEWSVRRRIALGIDAYFEGWVVSGELGVAKPQPAIYEHLLSLLPCPPAACLFVDDRVENLAPARDLGLRTLLFAEAPSDGFEAVSSFEALTAFVAARDT